MTKKDFIIIADSFIVNFRMEGIHDIDDNNNSQLSEYAKGKINMFWLWLDEFSRSVSDTRFDKEKFLNYIRKEIEAV